MDLMRACLDTTIPELELLDIQLFAVHNDPVDITIPSLPKLRFLATKHLSPRWGLPSPLPSLKKLSISHLPAPELKFDLRDLLLASPSLEKLVIETSRAPPPANQLPDAQPSDAFSNHSPTTPPKHSPTIHLANLQSMVLSWPSPELPLFLLNNVHTDVISTLRIHVYTAPLHSFMIPLEGLQNDLSLVRIALRNSGTKTLVVMESEISSGGKYPDVELLWEGGEGEPSVLAECLKCSGLPPIHLELYMWSSTPSQRFQYVMEISRILCLQRITFHAPAPSEFLDTLSHPLTETHHWLCPTVTEIAVELEYDSEPECTIEAIKAVITARAKAASEGDRSDLSAAFGERPREIQFLDCKGQQLVLEPPKKPQLERFQSAFGSSGGFGVFG